MQSAVLQYLDTAWVVVGVIWLVGALTARRTARVQSPSSRLFHICILVVAYVLLFTDRLRFGPLSWRFIPSSSYMLYAGLALTIAGLLFAVWARFFLGRNWSATITVKQDHTLVQSGPYSVVRHPIYSGITLAMLGTAITVGEVRGLVAVALALLGWRLKSGIEEGFMTDQFGTEYLDYKRRVKRLIPFVW